MSLWKIFDRAEQAIALIALLGLVLSVLFAGIGRSIGLPIAAAPQYAQLSLIWACMLGADIAARQGRHIRVTALADAVPPRVHAALSLLSLVLILPFLGFIAWYGWFLAINNWQRELGASGLSYGLVTLALPVGAVLLAVSFVRRLLAVGLAGVLDHSPVAGQTADTASNNAEDLL